MATSLKQESRSNLDFVSRSLLAGGESKRPTSIYLIYDNILIFIYRLNTLAKHKQFSHPEKRGVGFRWWIIREMMSRRLICVLWSCLVCLTKPHLIMFEYCRHPQNDIHDTISIMLIAFLICFWVDSGYLNWQNKYFDFYLLGFFFILIR